MRVVHIAGEAAPEVKVKKTTLTDRALTLTERLKFNYRRQAIKTFKGNAIK